MQKFSLAISSCPNDTFAFDALVHYKVMHPYQFSVEIKDIESLNQDAFEQKFEISKISMHAFYNVSKKYVMMDSGAALGCSCGPLIVGSQKKLPHGGKVALPGELTTATLLFKLATQDIFELVYLPFDQIIPAVLDRKVDFGVIIHESRFTYQQFALNCLLDLGEWWEEKYNLPLPLGGIMISREIEPSIQRDISNLIKLSIEFGEGNPESSRDYIRTYSQEIQENVLGEHIKLYVNQYSKGLGEIGKKAISTLYEAGVKKGLFDSSVSLGMFFQV